MKVTDGNNGLVGPMHPWKCCVRVMTYFQVSDNSLLTCTVSWEESASSINSETPIANSVALRLPNKTWWSTRIGLEQQEHPLFSDTIYAKVINGHAGITWEHSSAQEKQAIVKKACIAQKLPTSLLGFFNSTTLQLMNKTHSFPVIKSSVSCLVTCAIIKRPPILILGKANSA